MFTKPAVNLEVWVIFSGMAMGIVTLKFWKWNANRDRKGLLIDESAKA